MLSGSENLLGCVDRYWWDWIFRLVLLRDGFEVVESRE